MSAYAMLRRASLLVLALVPFGTPLSVFAHTKWFAHGEISPFIPNEPTALYFAIGGALALLGLMIGLVLERKGMLSLAWLLPKRAHAFERAASMFSMVAGAFFLIAGTHEYLFSPNLSHAAVGIPLFMVYAQIAIGLAFLLGIYARVAALFLALLWVMTFFVADTIAAVEDMWVLSTALFILIVGNDYFSIVSFRALAPRLKHYKTYALPILRIGAGATLLILGFSEKILHPEYGINFLALYDWNFMQMLGFPWYSDYLFTLSAGAVESFMGLMLVLGLMTRQTALVAAGFFTIPLFFLGPVELAGHLPHFAALILLILFGAGDHFRLIRKKRHG